MKKNKPILFIDFDGTICHDRYWRSLPSHYNEKIQNLLFRKDRIRVNDWLRGKYTAEEINEFVANEIDFPQEDLWKIFVDDCITMEVSGSVLERLSLLRKRYTVILITGNMDSFSRFTLPALKLDRYFDHISNSYHEGKHKIDNEGELFVEYAKKHGVSLKDCIIIDDSKNACSIFEEFGGTAYLVSPEKDITQYLELLEGSSFN